MASKHSREDASSAAPLKKRKTGFQVGPANLPDGTYRRKALKIKSKLIQKAKTKKDYARLKAQIARATEDEPPPSDLSPLDTLPTASLDPHPDRQALMETSPAPLPAEREQYHGLGSDRSRRPAGRRLKRDPFSKEEGIAKRQHEEAESRKQEREQADSLRRKKIQERQRLQSAMNKARRPGRDGRRRLGRESTVLLEKVKKLVAKD